MAERAQLEGNAPGHLTDFLEAGKAVQTAAEVEAKMAEAGLTRVSAKVAWTIWDQGAEVAGVQLLAKAGEAKGPPANSEEATGVQQAEEIARSGRMVRKMAGKVAPKVALEVATKA